MNYDDLDFYNAIIKIKPGSYLSADSNSMIKILKECTGIVIGQRIENDNSCSVIIGNEVLIISKNFIVDSIITNKGE